MPFTECSTFYHPVIMVFRIFSSFICEVELRKIPIVGRWTKWSIWSSQQPKSAITAVAPSQRETGYVAPLSLSTANSWDKTYEEKGFLWAFNFRGFSSHHIKGWSGDRKRQNPFGGPPQWPEDLVLGSIASTVPQTRTKQVICGKHTCSNSHVRGIRPSIWQFKI